MEVASNKLLTTAFEASFERVAVIERVKSKQLIVGMDTEH